MTDQAGLDGGCELTDAVQYPSDQLGLFICASSNDSCILQHDDIKAPALQRVATVRPPAEPKKYPTLTNDF